MEVAFLTLELVSNACVMFTFVFFSTLALRRLPALLNGSRRQRLTAGVANGLLGVVLMFFSFHPPGHINMLIDLRLIAVVNVAIFAGLYGSISAAIVIAVLRISIFGLNEVSILAAINALVIGVVTPLLIKMVKSNSAKVLVGDLYAILQFSVVFWYLTQDNHMVWAVLLPFWITSLLAGQLLYQLFYRISLSLNNYDAWKEESTKDFLTGLNNPRAFDKLYNATMERSHRHGESCSLLMVDIDHFKRVNDGYGHAAGDAVLRQLAELLSTTCRSIDHVCRQGGEEFSIIMPTCPSKDVVQLAERIRAAVERHPFQVADGTEIRVTVSIGCATMPDSTSDPEQLQKLADDGLYLAKRSGRNQVKAMLQ